MVSFEQFAKDWKDTFEQYSEEEIRNIYDSLKLPKRATTGKVQDMIFSTCGCDHEAR